MIVSVTMKPRTEQELKELNDLIATQNNDAIESIKVNDFDIMNIDFNECRVELFNKNNTQIVSWDSFKEFYTL